MSETKQNVPVVAPDPPDLKVSSPENNLGQETYSFNRLFEKKINVAAHTPLKYPGRAYRHLQNVEHAWHNNVSLILVTGTLLI